MIRNKTRLFCFPYAGGNIQIFSGWQDLLVSNVEVNAIQLPGRGRRLFEQPHATLRPLIYEVQETLSPHLHESFAFFGHSMGALVAFEMARMLRRSGFPEPVHLFISGHRAPALSATKSPIHHLPDVQLKKRLKELNGTPEEVLDDDELMQLLLPAIRADFSVCETYSYQSEPPLDCPITFFGGLEDKEVSSNEIEAWQDETMQPFTRYMLPGDHFFLHSQERRMCSIINDYLCPSQTI